jgi:hypothetical protein
MNQTNFEMAQPIDVTTHPDLKRYFDLFQPDVAYLASQMSGEAFQARAEHGLTWDCAGVHTTFMVVDDNLEYAATTTYQINDIYRSNALGFTYETIMYGTNTVGARFMVTFPLSEDLHGRYALLNGQRGTSSSTAFVRDRMMTDQERELARAGFEQDRRFLNWLFSRAGEEWYRSQGLIKQTA